MTAVSEHQKQSVYDRVSTLCQTASDYLTLVIEAPTISFRRSGGNAGTAHLQRNHINLNPIYLIDNHNEYIDQVIPHEIAHLVVYQCFGKVRPHGKEWQSVMLEIFKRPPLVRHTMSTSLSSQRTFNYQCGCGPTELTIRRHNKVVRGQQQYQCRRCREILTPVANATTV